MKENITKTQLNKIATHPLQTWEWGEFRESWGNEVMRLPFGQLMIHRIPKTKYKVGTFIRGGKPTKKMLDELKKLAKDQNLIFIKLEPNVAKTSRSTVEFAKEQKLLKENGCIPGKTLFTPTSFWIDLTQNEDEMMKSFHSKTRYNIRYATKKGVTVVEDNSDNAFEKYIELTRETVERQGFYAHTEKYHRLMWQHLHQSLVTSGQSPIARLLTARFKREIVSAWIVFVWKDFLYYPYGASTNKWKNVQANSLMMWEAIRYGKKNKLKTFDLWGREPGKGFTKFKEGYNPSVVKFLGTWDLVASPLYRPYLLADSLRWRILRAKSRFSKPSF